MPVVLPLVLPADLAASQSALAGRPATSVSARGPSAPRGWVAYRVRAGDTVFDLAAAHRASMAALVAVNRLADRGRLIRPGQLLMVPPAPHHAPAAPRPAYVVHVVRPGDTISDLAAHYRISPAVLLAANHLDRRGRIYAGQHVRVPTSAARAVAKHRRAASRVEPYRVRTGDTISLLALRFHTSQAAIRKANRLGARGFIQAGQTLRIPVPAARAAQGASATSFGGRTYPSSTVRAAARNRRALANRRLPSRTATRDLIVRTARRYGVDPGLALAVAWQESGWNQRQVSVANAIGTMQVVPATGEWAAGLVGRPLDLLDPGDNVTAGVVVLHALLRRASTEHAVAGYYQGLASVQQHGMYADTRAYVRSVLALRARFA